MKGKHTNNELSIPHNNTMLVTAWTERERVRESESETVRARETKWQNEEGNGMQFKPFSV